MKLFIGNATSQNFDFYYRLPEENRALHQYIAMGEQIAISGDLNQLQIDAIVHQGGTYGMISVDEVDRRATVYRGLCYSVDKAISSSKIEKLFHANTGVLVDIGKEIRRNAAIVENNRLLKSNQSMGLPNIRRTEMSIQEESDNPQENGVMSEGYRADFDTPTAPRRTRASK
jgi:hypothetical protein